MEWEFHFLKVYRKAKNVCVYVCHFMRFDIDASICLLSVEWNPRKKAKLHIKMFD